MFTAWGYEVDALPPILDIGEFYDLTGGKYDDVRAYAALSAASAAIRGACGWHISPSLGCRARRTGGGKVITLPAALVTAVSSVIEDGSELGADEYEWSRSGVLRRACFRNWSPRLDAVEVAYTAGLDAAAAPDLAQAVLGISEGVLSLPAGVVSESADGVSVSYSHAAQSVANALTDQFMRQLSTYRLVSCDAA